jgi:hypothetical protein
MKYSREGLDQSCYKGVEHRLKDLPDGIDRTSPFTRILKAEVT